MTKGEYGKGYYGIYNFKTIKILIFIHYLILIIFKRMTEQYFKLNSRLMFNIGFRAL